MSYWECDCKKFRYKALSFAWYKKPMGKGEPHTFSPENPKWKYAIPKSNNEHLLKQACKYAKDKFK